MDEQDSLTFVLDGEVSLNEFAEGIKNFSELIREVSDEVVGKNIVEWIVTDLQAGSAIVTVTGHSNRTGGIPNVIAATGNIWIAASRRQFIGYNASIEKKVNNLVDMVQRNQIRAIRLETAENDYEIAAVEAGAVAGEQKENITYARGTVTGTVETLTSRRALRFTLYDPVFDRAISCYLSQTQKDKMRDAWGKRVIVSGRVGRNRDKGYAVSVRDVVDVELVQLVTPGSYKQARGILKSQLSEMPEETVRRLRDGD